MEITDECQGEEIVKIVYLTVLNVNAIVDKCFEVQNGESLVHGHGLLYSYMYSINISGTKDIEDNREAVKCRCVRSFIPCSCIEV